MDSYLLYKLVTYLLRSEGAVSYRFLAQQFRLDEQGLEDLELELVQVRRVARD